MKDEFKTWENFKQIVKDARKHSVEWRKKHPELWNPDSIDICIHIDELVFALNVWRINLRTGNYMGGEYDLSDGIYKDVPNLKEVFEEKGGGSDEK